MATAQAPEAQRVESPRYVMTISRLTVDKLGVRLYDKVSAVIAELVANSYDADATEVQILAPMDELLATKQQGVLRDKGYVIEVRDNGVGMTPDEVNAFYLRVGAERRNDPRRGDRSRVFKRKVMGRKGVGKLAPFGICQEIEVITSGGDVIDGHDVDGESARGYLTAHLVLDRGAILTETDAEYEPQVGALDGTVQPERGTTLRLRNFAHRRVPEMSDLERQLAQRFGLVAPEWKIAVADALKTVDSPGWSRVVRGFQIATMDKTRMTFERPKNSADRDDRGRVLDEDGKQFVDLDAGFVHEDRFYPVTGWVAYAKEPYKDDLMAGIRIYCRGKIAAQTSIFNRRAGFTGEHDVRSYLVGELHADWLDDEEDLIQTDRRDILWSHELGQAFEAWGDKIVLKIGKLTRDPLKKKAWDLFREASHLEDRVAAAFPAAEQKPIADNALELAKLVGQTMRTDEATDPEYADSIVQLSLTLAPHVTLDQKLRAAADVHDSPLSVMTSILRTARIAELSSFGRIAEDRIKVIDRVESLKDDPATIEAMFQELIDSSPWLIDPQWSPITANQSFSTLKAEFAKYYKQKTGDDLNLVDFADPSKRADIVLSSQDNVVQIIEIKRPHHLFEDAEMDRLNKYIDMMRSFLGDETHKDFRKVFSDLHATLVCDGEELTGVHKTAFNGLIHDRVLEHIDWTTFLFRTRRMHDAFLQEAERQRKNAART